MVFEAIERALKAERYVNMYTSLLECVFNKIKELLKNGECSSEDIVEYADKYIETMHEKHDQMVQIAIEQLKKEEEES